jgi:hypothetical protein
MHEPAKAVIVLALSAAVAVWLLGAALHLWPDTGQLAYGNPLPHLKVRMDSGAVKFWVEDFNRLQYERVWLYVNGRLAASGGLGTNAAAKCGDEVAAVVKYHSGVKKLEGRILCTKPIKAPGETEAWDTYSMMMLAAYRAATGDFEATGLPLKITGSVDCNGKASVMFESTAPNVFLCYDREAKCGQSLTFAPGEPRRVGDKTSMMVVLHVYKIPDTVVASQYLGGARAAFVIANGWERGYYSDIYYLTVNGTLVARCEISNVPVGTETYTVTEYVTPKASGVFMTRWQLPNGTVFDASIHFWIRPDGTCGFQTWINRVDKPPSKPCAGIPNSIYRYCGEVNRRWFLNATSDKESPMSKFIDCIATTQTGEVFHEAMEKLQDISYNIPVLTLNHTFSYTIWKTTTTKESYTISLSLRAVMPASLGVIFASAVLPSGIQTPTVNKPNGTKALPFSFVTAYGG